MTWLRVMMMSRGLSLLVLMYLANGVAVGQDLPVPVAACDSPVYCHGDLLDTIQRRALYDSKEFVDMALLYDPDVVVRNFERLPSNPTDQQLRQFVDENFSSKSDLVAWSPPDWVERPLFVDSIKDSQLRQWALDLTAIWQELGRQLSPDVHAYPQRHSLIPVPNPFIVAGGRFSEYYYWDSYWIIRGLLLCEMYDTARGIIENMAALVDNFGMVPNGGRVYYSRRSQPPLLTQMVAAYYNATGNDSFVKEMLPVLEEEYQFWQENRSVFLESLGYEANHYATITNQPRPESYLADVNTSEALSNETARYQLFTDLASGAESGWDFSSRWFAIDGPFPRQLASIRTTSIVPVDLNAILCSNEATLSWFHNITGNFSAAEYFVELLQTRQESFDEIFWDESTGTWRDLDIMTSEHLDDFYLSSVVPLVWGCGPSNTSKQLSTLSYLESAGFLDFPGGIPTSKVASGQQWDFPNAWPPLQWMLIYGLSQGSHETLKMAAEEIAQKWVSANWLGWKQNRSMFEKYDSEVPGMPGSGGEYVVQSGFGWTNGVILDLLNLYGSSLVTPPLLNMTNATNTTNTSSGNDSRHDKTAWVIPIAVLVPLMFLCVVCIVWGRWVYKRGKKRYWQRVQNEHLMAYGTMDDNSEPTYGIGNEDEQHKSLPRQNSGNGKTWYEQADDKCTTVVPAATALNMSQEDSGILSNRASDNISDSTVVDKADEHGSEDNEQRNDTTKGTKHKSDDWRLQETEESGDVSNNEHSKVTLTIVCEGSSQTTKDTIPNKILTTDI